MPDKIPTTEAITVLRSFLAEDVAQRTSSESDRILRSFTRFACVEFALPDVPDADGLLFQYGIYAFTGRPMFILSLVRQFEQFDRSGEHEALLQVNCEILYEPDAELGNIGRWEAWWFKPQGGQGSTLSDWLAAVAANPIWQLVRGRRETSVSLTMDQV